MKLNLGCGEDVREGYVNVDFEKVKGVDVVLDLNDKKSWKKFKDNQFDEILMRSVIEHLDDIFEIMKEIRRIARPGAVIKIRTPHYSSIHAWTDIQHRNAFGVQSFTSGSIEGWFSQKSMRLEIPRRNKIFIFPWIIANLSPAAYEKWICHLFPATDMVTELIINK